MARRRLLTILAASAVLGTVFAAPAAALDLVEETGTEVGEVVADVEQATVEATEEVGAVIEDTPAEEPIEQVAEVVEVVEDVAEQVPAPAPAPSPDPEPRTRTTTPAASSAPVETEVPTVDVIAAGGVGDAPSLDARTGRGAPASLAGGSLPTPVTAPAAPAAEEVDAPLVAPPLATDATAPSVLALPATAPGSGDEVPVLALIALASLLAAGGWTLGEARATGSIPTGTTATA